MDWISGLEADLSWCRTADEKLFDRDGVEIPETDGNYSISGAITEFFDISHEPEQSVLNLLNKKLTVVALEEYIDHIPDEKRTDLFEGTTL